MISRVVDVAGTAVVGDSYGVLMDWHKFGFPDQLLFWAAVASDGVPARCIVESSQVGSVPDAAFVEFDLGPSAEGSVMLTTDAIRVNFRLRAKSLSGTPVSLVWGVSGYYLAR